MSQDRCRWPRGCDQTAYEDAKFICAYHQKVVQGLINVSPAAFTRRGLNRAGVLDDERLALGAAMKALGASDEAVKSAITGDPHHQPQDQRRKGSGVRQGRWAGPGTFANPRP